MLDSLRETLFLFSSKILTTMPTYLYETIPAAPGDPVTQYEFRQSMKDAAYTRHPETGEPIHRVITGGYGFLKSPAKTTPTPHIHRGGCCGGSGRCH